MRNRLAFTLIELSIVLVVIGLLIGGVTYGMALVRVAELRAGIAQIAELDNAVLQFKNRYNGLPGDARLSQFTQFATRTGLPSRGDSDGVVEHLWGASQTGEVLVFWSDLYKQGLLRGASDVITSMTTTDPYFPAYLDPDTNLAEYFPRSGFPDSFVFLTSGVYNTNNSAAMAVYSLGHAYVIARSYISTNGIYNNDRNNSTINQDQATIPAFSAYSLDAKIDDGSPLTGDVLSVDLRATDGVTLGQTGSNNCYTGTEYNRQERSAQEKCQLAIKAGF